MPQSTPRVALAAAAEAIRRLSTRWRRPAAPNPDAAELAEGDTRLAVVRDGAVVAETRDVALSHAEFVHRSLGTLPEGAWVGTVRKAGGVVVALNSRTFYGNQLPPAQPVIDAVRARFR
jgi:hypothetical protein